VSDRYQTSEDAVLTALAADGVVNNDSDPDHPRSEFSVVPGNITSTAGASIVMASDGSFTYDPRSAVTLQRLLGGATLDDTFAYRLQDAGGAVSQLVTVTVTVQGANDAPNAVNDVLGATPNGTTTLNVLANDIDPDSTIDVTSVQLGVLPANGTVAVLADGRFSYTPNLGFRGSDSFSYRVRDAFGVLSNEGLVTVRINNLPVAVPDRASVLAGSSVVINVLNNDTDGDGVNTINRSSVVVVSNSPNGTAVVLSDGTIRFTPASNFTSGTTTFTYSIKDSENPPAESAPGVVTVDVVQSLYQNVTNRFDVNNDGFVSPVDALIVINDINRRGSRPLPPGSFTPPPFIDVNGSGSVEPIDVLQVINYLNRQSRGLNGEGERTAETFVPAVVIAAPANVNSGLVSTSFDVMTVTPEQVMQTVAQQVTKVAQQRLQDVAIALDSNTNEDDSIAIELSDSLTLRKRSLKTDSVFADSTDEFWE
jgi:VCBS repeat-containing protein